jgi:deazaflavin-dependent oxidoreductase (nitroreductase family)
MPGSRGLARFNRKVTNVITSRFAPWAPGFGIMTHQGRHSGQLYRTPVNVFPRGDKYVVALTYGPDSDWVKNVLAAGEADLRARGRMVHLTAPRLFHDETRHLMPLPVRLLLRWFGVADFLELQQSPRKPLSQAAVLTHTQA